MVKRFFHGVRVGILLTCMSALSLAGCTGREPILVGFASELTGWRADLGTHERDGAQLAVDTINAASGVAGRSIELLVCDDLGTPEGAQAADRELIDAGVVAIIGHATSGQSTAALPVIEEAGVVLLSPTTSTQTLNGLDDHFFRVDTDSTTEARWLARHVYRERDLARMAVIHDTDNAPFSGAFWNAFAEEFHNLGGQMIGEQGFSSAQKPDFAILMAELMAFEPNGVLVVASAADAALIAQQSRLGGWETPLFSSAWAQTDTLLQHGGQAVEGMEFVNDYDTNNQAFAFLDFQARYQARFGRAPTFAAAQAYEAVLVLAEALRKTGGRTEGLRQALLETKDFEGLVGTISMDKYGDVIRTYFLHTVENGEFVTRSSIEP